MEIAGIGAIANVGNTPRQIFDSLCAGAGGPTALAAFNTAKFRVGHAYEIDDRSDLERRGDRPMRASGWLRTAVADALSDAGIEPGDGPAGSGGDVDLAAIPVLVGTTMREQRSVELWWRGKTSLSVADLHFGTSLRVAFGSTLSYTFANACAAGLSALALASDLIQLGMADRVVVAGTDSIPESAFGVLDRTQPQVPDAVRPFDRGQRGMLMGEGAVALVLQRAGVAAEQVHARLRGVAMNCDARHPTAPDVEGISRVVRDAYRRAGVQPADIDLVMLHGSGTRRNDEAEAAMMTGVLSGISPGPLLTAVKSATGHTLGGSGLLSLVMAVLSIQRGLVPPIHGLFDPIPAARGLRLVRDRAVAAEPTTAQVNAFGFGGNNAVAILEAADERGGGVEGGHHRRGAGRSGP